jgi:hypothetical protein
MDYSKIKNTAFEGVDYYDYSDFVDSFCVYAEIEGVALTEEELNELNDSDEKYELLMQNLN